MKPTRHNDLGFLVEQCQQININDFVAQSKQQLKKEFIRQAIAIDDYDVELTTSNMPRGGLRYWFKCPYCLERVGRLYKHPANQLLACRGCHGLEYRCRRYKGMIESNL